MKKTIIITLVLIVLFLMIIASKVKAENYLPLLGKVIVIDPGHGGL